MRNHSGFHIQQRMDQILRQRESRIFLAGFWAGFAPGVIMCVACVALALWLRG